MRVQPCDTSQHYSILEIPHRPLPIFLDFFLLPRSIYALVRAEIYSKIFHTKKLWSILHASHKMLGFRPVLNSNGMRNFASIDLQLGCVEQLILTITPCKVS